jgi:hypothetical protein
MNDSVWFVPLKTEELVSPYERHAGAAAIESAQPFTVSLVTVVVAEDLDGFLRGRNDVLVLTRSSLGEQPLVERVHFYEEEVPKGKPIRNILANTVFLTDDYNGKDRLWLELNVIEVDTDTGERKAAVQAFQSLAVTAGAVFPALVPYSFGASAVIGVVEKLVGALEKDTDVVKVPFGLYPGEPQPGRAPMQAGTYVVFAQPQDPGQYKLHANGLLTSSDKPSDVSYAVFNLTPAKEVSPKYVVKQKVATLLTQLRTGNPNSPLPTLDFLTETLNQYTNFTKLDRYLKLKAKGELTDQESTLMREIEQNEALKPFLPKA